MTKEKENEKEWEEVTSNADWWDFDKNKEISGIYHAKREHFGANDSNVYVVKTGEDSDGKGIFFSFWGKTALDGKMNDVKIGEEVRVVFNGEKLSKNNKTYFDYSVFHRPAPLEEV